MIPKPKYIKSLSNYSLSVGFDDGTQGIVDLQHLAHKGVFKEWDKNNLFSKVYISDYGAIAWNDDLDICPDNIYLKLKGMNFEQFKQKEYASSQ